MVHLHMRIHAHGAIQFADLKVRLADNISATRLLDERRKRDLLEGIADMPDGDRLCHGDFHPMKYWGKLRNPSSSSIGQCRSYLLMKLHAAEIATAYVDAYCRAAVMPHEVVLSWLPYVAVARLAEDVPGELDHLLKIVDTSLLN